MRAVALFASPPRPFRPRRRARADPGAGRAGHVRCHWRPGRADI